MPLLLLYGQVMKQTGNRAGFRTAQEEQRMVVFSQAQVLSPALSSCTDVCTNPVESGAREKMSVAWFSEVAAKHHPQVVSKLPSSCRPEPSSFRALQRWVSLTQSQWAFLNPGPVLNPRSFVLFLAFCLSREKGNSWYHWLAIKRRMENQTILLIDYL